MRKKFVKILICAVIAAIGLVAIACSNPHSCEQLETPKNLRVEDGALVWDEVDNAVEYAVHIDTIGFPVNLENDKYTMTEARFNLSELTQTETLYILIVQALGDLKYYTDSAEARFSYIYTPEPTPIPTVSGNELNTFNYTLLPDGSGYEVYHNQAYAFERVVVPDYYNGLPVKKIANGAFGNDDFSIKMGVIPRTVSVRLPDTLEEIGDEAFLNCFALTEVNIPDGVTVIGASAFASCGKLKSISMPDSVTHLGSHAFVNCSSLAEIRFSQNLKYVGDAVVGGTKWLNQKVGVVAVQGFLLSFKGPVPDGSEIVISQGIKHIPGQSFVELSGKDITLTIPDGVTIGGRAFYKFGELKSIRLPSDLTTIPDYAFYCCESLQSIIIPDGVTEIGEGAFRQCSSLESVELPSELTEIGKDAFYRCSALTSLELPQKLRKISADAFEGCTKLASLHLPDSLTEVHYTNDTIKNIILSPTVLTTVLPKFKMGVKYYITCSPEENEYDYVAIYTGDEYKLLYNWMKKTNPFYLYVENEQDLPDDGGNYWHYADDGKTPVIWQVQSDE